MGFPEALSSFMRLWIARKGNPTCRSSSFRRGEAEAKMSGFDWLMQKKCIALCQNTDDNCSSCFGGCLKAVRLFILLTEHKLVAYSPYFFKNSRSCGPGNIKKLHFFKEKVSACWMSGLDGTIFAEANGEYERVPPRTSRIRKSLIARTRVNYFVPISSTDMLRMGL
jgi:hypothetical protein